MAKAAHWPDTDAEARKRGEQTGLDTLVVHAVNDESSTHRLRRGLPGYLILFAPHAFAPQRQNRTREPPSPLVFFPISTNFTSTLGIPLSSPGL